MKCVLCGYEFNEAKAKTACEGCPLGEKCGLVKCPNCGYESPKTPQWLTKKENKIKNKREV
ncbi:MAG: hypothetical protein WCJ46_06195 [bacterium]